MQRAMVLTFAVVFIILARIYSDTGGKTHLDVYGRHYSFGIKYCF